jgi:hypothetical protein
MRVRIAICAACVLVVLLAGCGRSAGSGGDTACVVLDASASTRYIVPHYLGELGEEVDRAAEAGGTVAVLVATGRPGTEATVEEESFDGLTGVEMQGSRAMAVRHFLGKTDALDETAREGGADPTAGSAIVEAIGVVSEGRSCGSIVVLSDGLETRAFQSKSAGIADPSRRRALVARLRGEGLVPELDGAVLAFPFGGALPQGTAIGQAILRALPEFWSEYAHAAGGAFAWRQAP